MWGLHPRVRWRQGQLGNPDAEPGLVRVEADDQLRPGVSLQLAGFGAWITLFDNETGWARVSADPSEPDEHAVLVAAGVAISLGGERLTSVWLHPFVELS